MAVPLGTEPTFSPGKPIVLFRGASLSFIDTTGQLYLTPWDISPDGKRVLLVKMPSAAAEAPRKINIVLNWTEELKQRVPFK